MKGDEGGRCHLQGVDCTGNCTADGDVTSDGLQRSHHPGIRSSSIGEQKQEEQLCLIEKQGLHRAEGGTTKS